MNIGSKLRQGDLLLVRTKPVAAAKPSPGGTVLARGEATGHAHAIAAADLSGVSVFLDERGRLIVNVGAGRARVEHQEHATVELDEGTWEVRRQRQYESEGWRTVAD